VILTLTLPINDIGSDIKIDTDITLDSATTIEIHVTKPSGATDTWDAVTSGVAQEIVHTTESGDIDEAGFYKIHANIEFSGGDPFTGTDTILEVTDGTASTEAYLSLYWSGLKAQLDAVDTGVYSDLVYNAVESLDNFNTSHLSSAQVKQAVALLVCIDCSEMSGLAGWSQEKYFDSLKIYDRTMKKESGLDHFTGSFCRLLKISLKEFNTKTSAQRAEIYEKTRSDTIYLAPDLDQRGKVFKDYDLSKVRSDRNSYPLDSRYK
jgi:hypothetical protein